MGTAESFPSRTSSKPGLARFSGVSKTLLLSFDFNSLFSFAKIFVRLFPGSSLRAPASYLAFLTELDIPLLFSRVCRLPRLASLSFFPLPLGLVDDSSSFHPPAFSRSSFCALKGLPFSPADFFFDYCAVRSTSHGFLNFLVKSR